MNRRSIVLGLSVVLLAVFVYDGVLRQALRSIVPLPVLFGDVSRLTLLLMLFSLSHATYALGWRHSLTFFVLSAVISWGFEQVGVETGAIYGRYHYTDVLGPKLGHVPFLIPLAWFMMIYPSYVIATLIVEGRPTGTPGRVGRLLWLAVISAMVMTAWDLVVDPVLSGPAVRAWIWEDGGPYFDIPLQNYVGWMLTTFAVYLAYRAFERSARPRPMGGVTASIAALPVLAYGAMMAANVLSGGGPPALAVIGPFVMGIPFVAAVEKLVRYRSELRPAAALSGQ